MSKTSLLLSGVAAAALLAGAAQAQTARSGYGEFGIAYGEVDAGFFEEDTTAVFVGASGATPFGQGNGFVQGDIFASKAEDDGLETIGGQAFIATRDSARRALAAFAVVEHVDSGAGSDDTIFGGGVEGALYRGQNTFQGQIAYLTSDDSDADIYGAAIQARRYINENLSIEGNALIAQADSDGSDDTFYGVGVLGEWQPSPGPVAFFAGVKYYTGDDSDVDATVGLIGVRVRGGTTTLYDYDRRGASLRGARAFTSAVGALGSAGSSYSPPDDDDDDDFDYGEGGDDT